MCSNLARKAAPHSFHVRIVAVPKIEAACCVTIVEVPSFTHVVPVEVPSVCSVRRHHSNAGPRKSETAKLMRVASSLIIAALKNTSTPNNHAETVTNLSLGLNGGGFVCLILTVVEAVTAVGTVAVADVVAAAVAGACVGTARDCCRCARLSSAASIELSSSLKTASFGVELLLASSTMGDSWRAAPRVPSSGVRPPQTSSACWPASPKIVALTRSNPPGPCSASFIGRAGGG
ncbi:unnamed protein product [Closterium sp. NIES-54]